MGAQIPAASPHAGSFSVLFSNWLVWASSRLVPRGFPFLVGEKPWKQGWVLSKDYINLLFARSLHMRSLVGSSIFSKEVMVNMTTSCVNLFSIVSKAYWSEEHAGSVCGSVCRDGCCITGADYRNMLEKETEKVTHYQQSRIYKVCAFFPFEIMARHKKALCN